MVSYSVSTVNGTSRAPGSLTVSSSAVSFIKLPSLPSGFLQPGEGLLVGSFARCLALVHSECGESEYIAARPFRVNAGPVRRPPGRARPSAGRGAGELEGGRRIHRSRARALAEY